MINVEINGKLVGQCESAGKASSPLFKDVIEPWIEIRGFIASSPSLTDNQQIVLKRLKANYIDGKSNPINSIWLLHDYYTSMESLGVVTAYTKLTDKEEAQVLQAFAKWILEQEEE